MRLSHVRSQRIASGAPLLAGKKLGGGAPFKRTVGDDIGSTMTPSSYSGVDRVRGVSLGIIRAQEKQP